MNRNFETIIDEDGSVRLSIRIQGPHKRSIRLIAIVDTASSYTIIPPYACQLLNLPQFDKQTQKSQYSQEAATYKPPQKSNPNRNTWKPNPKKKHTNPMPPHPPRGHNPRTHLPKRLQSSIRLETKHIHTGRIRTT